jgi:hypothetical protein
MTQTHPTDFPLFDLGRCGVTPGARDVLGTSGVWPKALLRRHVHGDWAELGAVAGGRTCRGRGGTAPA